jgi:ketosteroid isomerase-like protein
MDSAYILNLVLKEFPPMRSHRYLLVLLVVFGSVIPSVLPAQGATPAQAIRAVLDKQVVDWNRGDLTSFATGYKNSPDILFMGAKIAKGYAQMVDTYRKNYSTKEKMGVLTFSALEVQPLDEHFATVTGNFHLERTAAGGGNADGYFLLVFEKTPDGWKIVRDATTVPPKKAVQ